MIIKVSADLKEQEIWANGIELSNIMGMDFVNGKRISFYPSKERKLVHTFSDPILMTDNYRIAQLSPTLRDTLFSLFQSYPRIVEYDGVSTSWDERHKGVWSPSIDTLLFAKVLNGFLSKNKNIKKGVEIGCGSGFLTKYILAKSKNIEQFLAIDINPNAIKSVEDNIHDNRLDVHCGDGIEKIKNEKYDLIVCNPPYVPRIDSIDDNPYEGISVIRELVHNGQKYLSPNGVLLLNTSSLCWNLVFDKELSMNFKVLDKMKVPLKVNNILNNADWIKYLIKLGLKKDFHDGYEYWHEISILEFKNQ